MNSEEMKEIDINSVDYQPLFQSVNGAAITALHQHDDDTVEVKGGGYFAVQNLSIDTADSKVDTKNHSRKYMSSYIVSSAMTASMLFSIVVIAAVISNYLDVLSSPYNEDGGTLRSDSHAMAVDIISPQGVHLAPPLGTQIPSLMEDTFADIDDLPIELMDTAIYWHVPRSAGTTMKHMLATCLGKVITTEIGGLHGHIMDERLELLKQPHGVFLNVDTTTQAGLIHAKKMGLVPSKMADVIFTPYVQETHVLFDLDHRGRFFTMLRDPVERLTSLYYYKRLATWEQNYNGTIQDISLQEFAQSYGENWMVRTLTGRMSGPLRVMDLYIAKELLRKKFLIGLIEEKTESLRRFEEYFGWRFPSPVSQTCKNNMFYFEWHSRNPHPPIENDVVYNNIKTWNMWDVSLYEYAKQLFHEQEQLIWN